MKEHLPRLYHAIRWRPNSEAEFYKEPSLLWTNDRPVGQEVTFHSDYMTQGSLTMPRSCFEIVKSYPLATNWDQVDKINDDYEFDFPPKASPPERYPAWIDTRGRFFKCGHQEHHSVARRHALVNYNWREYGNPADFLLDKGWIQFWYTGQMAHYKRLNKSQLKTIKKLSELDNDKDWKEMIDLYQAWCARITLNYVRHYLGAFKNPIDAARAYDASARELFGAYAKTNFPE